MGMDKKKDCIDINTDGHKRMFALKKILAIPSHSWYFVKCIFLFKMPFSLIYHYIRGTSLPDKMVLLRNGLKITLSDHPHDIRTVFVIFVRNDYGRVNRDDIVVDIGANIGIFSLYAAFCGAKKVYSYEPNQKNYDVLVHNIKINGLEGTIKPHKLIVSAVAGQRMKFPLSSGPYNRIIPNEDTTNSYELVPTTTIDSIVSDNTLGRVGLLKADCEGEEYNLLFNTNQDTFSKIKNIRLEFHRWPLGDLIAHLRTHGFVVNYIHREKAVMWLRMQK